MTNYTQRGYYKRYWSDVLESVIYDALFICALIDIMFIVYLKVKKKKEHWSIWIESTKQLRAEMISRLIDKSMDRQLTCN